MNCSLAVQSTAGVKHFYFCIEREGEKYIHLCVTFIISVWETNAVYYKSVYSLNCVGERFKIIINDAVQFKKSLIHTMDI